MSEIFIDYQRILPRIPSSSSSIDEESDSHESSMPSLIEEADIIRTHSEGTENSSEKQELSESAKMNSSYSQENEDSSLEDEGMVAMVAMVDKDMMRKNRSIYMNIPIKHDDLDLSINSNSQHNEISNKQEIVDPFYRSAEDHIIIEIESSDNPNILESEQMYSSEQANFNLALCPDKIADFRLRNANCYLHNDNVTGHETLRHRFRNSYPLAIGQSAYADCENVNIPDNRFPHTRSDATIEYGFDDNARRYDYQYTNNAGCLESLREIGYEIKNVFIQCFSCGTHGVLPEDIEYERPSRLDFEPIPSSNSNLYASEHVYDTL
jgi:hypothetical protein